MMLNKEVVTHLQALPLYLYRKPKESHEESQPGEPAFGPGIEHVPSQIQSKSTNRSEHTEFCRIWK